MEWRIVEKDGNPKKEGVYFVIVIHPKYYLGEDTGSRVAEIDSRLFGNAEDWTDWIMEGQPDNGLVWKCKVPWRQGEYVYAWLEMDEKELPKLPEGVVYE